MATLTERRYTLPELDFLPSRLRGKFAFVETVTKLTNELVASYARVGGINHLDGKNLPSKRAIAAITQDLLRLLFPGYFDEKLIHSNTIPRPICRNKTSPRRRTT
jgi:hypothetical protein